MDLSLGFNLGVVASPTWFLSLAASFDIASPVLALDPYNTRYYRAGAQRSVSDALSTDWAGGGLILGADGAYQSFAANQAPVLSGVGLDIWGQAVNGLSAPEDFTDPAWAQQGGATTQADQAVAPDGTMTMDKVTEGVGLGQGIQYAQNISAVAGQYFVVSVHVKSDDLPFARLSCNSPLGAKYGYFDLATGAKGSTNTVSGITPLTNGIYRVSMLTGPYTSGTPAIYLVFVRSDQGATNPRSTETADGSVAYVWGAMTVDDDIPMPYASGTRYATNVTDPDFAAIASAYGLSSGLKIGANISLDRLSDPADRCVWSLGADADNCIRVDVTTTNTARLTVRASAVDVLTLETTAFGATGDKAITATLKDGAWALEATGVTGDSDAGTYGLPTLSSFRYGSKFGNSAYLNGDLNNLVLGRAA